MWFLYLIVITGTLMTFLRTDTAKRTILACILLLLGKYMPHIDEVQIIIRCIAMIVWYWAVFSYIYLSSRNLPIRKYL